MKDEIKYCSRIEGIIGYGDSKIAKKETNDCVVVTIASCFDITYDKAHKFCKEYFNRYDREGTMMVPNKMYSFYISNKTLNYKKIKPIGEKSKNHLINHYSLDYDVKVKGVKTKRKMTVGTFIKQNPTGTFFMLVDGHAFTLKDGVVIGNPNDATQKKKHLQYVWQVK